ncbi:type II toxin-antitoxin system RelE/ParE family toxin, partial [Rhizobium leguminosarum]|uniref:type II toxin-antitoxin system RelE/ParE family toxin n=1 Tax=Rhizobium leguminosarum TaxID=384 RepID=UPI003F99259F
MIVLITAQAEADLERIGDYIAADNPQRAARRAAKSLMGFKRPASASAIPWPIARSSAISRFYRSSTSRTPSR